LTAKTAFSVNKIEDFPWSIYTWIFPLRPKVVKDKNIRCYIHYPMWDLQVCKYSLLLAFIDVVCLDVSLSNMRDTEALSNIMDILSCCLYSVLYLLRGYYSNSEAWNRIVKEPVKKPLNRYKSVKTWGSPVLNGSHKVKKKYYCVKENTLSKTV